MKVKLYSILFFLSLNYLTAQTSEDTDLDVSSENSLSKDNVDVQDRENLSRKASVSRSENVAKSTTAILNQSQTHKKNLLLQKNKDGENRFQYALMLYTERKFESAKLSFQEFVTLFPRHARELEASRYIALLLEEQGETKKALEAYYKIYYTDPNSIDAILSYLQIGRIQSQMGNKNLAIEIFRNLVKEQKTKNSEIARIAQIELYTLGFDEKTLNTDKI